jgi:hypothetical protein
MFAWLMGLLVARGSKPLRVRLQVEQLEVRVVPYAFYWTDGIGDDKWSTLGNWY